jgi:hypothetical protein
VHIALFWMLRPEGTEPPSRVGGERQIPVVLERIARTEASPAYRAQEGPDGINRPRMPELPDVYIPNILGYFDTEEALRCFALAPGESEVARLECELRMLDPQTVWQSLDPDRDAGAIFGPEYAGMTLREVAEAQGWGRPAGQTDNKAEDAETRADEVFGTSPIPRDDGPSAPSPN